ncbi:MAG TPA: FtsX-like permease family protein, partial [Terriglobales bacterium]|nr:FtsX-like permease family protein [Terriglobales bacterium]
PAAPPPPSPRARWFSAGNALTVVQFALAVVVLAGAGLLVRTLQNLRSINPELSGYKDAQSRAFYRDLRERLAALPGVMSVSYSSIPMVGGSSWSRDIHIEGQPEQSRVEIYMVPAGPDFLDTMRIPLLAGRRLTPADLEQAAAIQDAQKAKTPPTGAVIPVLINQKFARTLNGGGNPLGVRFTMPAPPPGSLPNPGLQRARKYFVWEVVGVTGDIKYGNLRRAIRPVMFEPWTGGIGIFEVRTSGDPKALIPTVRSLVAGMDANLPLFGVRTQSETINERLNQEQAIARLSSFFGALALLLACIGVYGLLSYEVTRRTREIGIRTALGARPGDVLRLVVGQGIALACAGAILGALVAFDLTRYLKTLLYGVSPADPGTFIAVAAVLMLVAVAACYLPARRASRVDPIIALRYQ